MMAEAAGSALARLVSMVHLIDDRPGITVDQLATHFGRSRAQVRADIDTLDRAGFGDLLPDKTFEIDYDLYLEKGRLALRTPLNLLAPLPLTEQEFALLLTALGTLAPLLSDQERRWLPRTISALMAMRAPSSKTEGSPPIPWAVESRLRDLVNLFRTAIAQGANVEFDYVSGTGHHSQRTFNPDALTLDVDGWVSTGFCFNAQERRSFRLDRMTHVRLLDAPRFPPIPYVQRPELDPIIVEVDLYEQARWALGESAAKATKVHPDGTMTATYEVFYDGWLQKELLSLAPWVITTRPIRYLQEAAAFSKDALARQDAALRECADAIFEAEQALASEPTESPRTDEDD